MTAQPPEPPTPESAPAASAGPAREAAAAPEPVGTAQTPGPLQTGPNPGQTPAPDAAAQRARGPGRSGRGARHAAAQAITPAPAAALQATGTPDLGSDHATAAATSVPAGFTAAEIARLARHRRARKLARGVLAWVGLPTLLATIYFLAIAHNEYESVTTLVFGGGTESGEHYATMFREHALSRDMLTNLDARTGFCARFARSGDFFSRLSSHAGSETRYAFYRRHVDAQYDASGHVFTLRVRAFSGAEARAFAHEILRAGQAFLETHGASAHAIVVIAAPSAPDEATYPQRAYGIITAFFTSLALFGVGSLLVAAVREHGHF